MERLFVCAGFSLSGILFAQGSVDGTGMNWSNITALGIVAVVLVFIVTRMLPDLHKKFVDQSEVFARAMIEGQKGFGETVEKIAERNHDDQADNAKAVRELAMQCAARAASGNNHPDKCR